MRGIAQNFANTYKYGYQGSEKDNEVSGGGTSYTTEFRQLDPRLGRWFSVDPIFQPFQSPYTAMDNDPINNTDRLGLTGTDVKHKVKAKETLNQLAADYGTTPQKIKEANTQIKWDSDSKRTGKKKDWIYSGETLNIPVSKETKASIDGNEQVAHTGESGTPNGQGQPKTAGAGGAQPPISQNVINQVKGTINELKKQGVDIKAVHFVFQDFTGQIYEHTKESLKKRPDLVVLTSNGGGAAAEKNRRNALKGVPPCGSASGCSRDEFPYASTLEGGAGAFVKCVPILEQNTQAVQLRALKRMYNLQAGDKILIVLVPKGKMQPIEKPVDQPVNVPNPIPIFFPFWQRALPILERSIIRVPIIIFPIFLPDDGLHGSGGGA